MKLITAIRMIEEREKKKRKAEKEARKNGLFLKNHPNNRDPGSQLKEDENMQKNLIHVQSIFPQDDIIALKAKTREAHIREAISKAVYYYLKTAAKES